MQSQLKVELDALQESADAHTAIATLEEELTREYETIEESVKDCSSLLCRFNLQHLEKLPKLAGDGQALMDTVDAMSSDIREKLNDAQDRLNIATTTYNRHESTYSEKSWALRAGLQSLQSLQQQSKELKEGPISTLRTTIEAIRDRYPDMTSDEPSVVRSYLDRRIEQLSEDIALADPKIVKIVM